jgi:uncharacterized membrane protein YdjX (TVP38/TMEM64 family)
VKLYQKIGIAVWGGLILCTILLFVMRPDLLDGNNLKEYISQNSSELKVYFATICTLRCLTLIPATPFIVAGVLLFPDDLDFVFIVVMTTILIAATIHFKLSRVLGFDDYLNRKFSSRMEKLKTGMQKRGFLYILLWTMAPFLPSDLAYYLAGISGMKFQKFILAVLLGGVTLSGVYIYMGKNFFEWMLGM